MKYNEKFPISNIKVLKERKICLKRKLEAEKEHKKQIEQIFDEQEIAIGSMRQWLNEDVVNKKHRYLTNEDLKIWFK